MPPRWVAGYTKRTALEIGRTGEIEAMHKESGSKATLKACHESGDRGTSSVPGSRITGTVVRYDEILGSITSLLIALNRTLDVVYWNGVAADLLGTSCDAAIGKRITALPLSWNASAIREALERCHLTNVTVRLDDMEFASRDQSRGWLGLKVSPLRNHEGAIAGFLIQGAEITDRKRLENEFLQAQKMEAIGRLAGNIAHDFNNILTIIMGQCELLLNNSNTEEQRRNRYQEIRECVQHAAGMTKHLLNFSRKQCPSTSGCSINNAINDSRRFLAKAVGERIQLEIEIGTFSSQVAVDPVHLTQVLLNMAVNARDAMPQGGRLRIATESFSQVPAGGSAGQWVRITVSDTGEGIDPAIRDHIFEPFFTTKESDKGTGLGLSTVYSIVKQAGGNISVLSEPRHGTTFKIELPCLSEKLLEHEPMIHESVDVHRGTETILLVEDDLNVRELVCQLLTSLGYKVLPAADCFEALRLANDGRNIELLLTDWMMPQMNGLQLADQVRLVLPQCRVLVISGYQNVVNLASRELDTTFVQKPFSMKEIAKAVRQSLDSVPKDCG